MMANQDIKINDLLSFFINKLNVVPKEKLINCINDFYSKHEIFEAKNMLMKSLATEMLPPSFTVESEDKKIILISIYECLKIFMGHLPTFVCKNLNNIPRIDSKDLEQNSSIKDFSTNKDCLENFIGLENQNWNEDICRREQQEMKLKISEMLAIISDLKNGLEKYRKSSDRIIARRKMNDVKGSQFKFLNKFNKPDCEKSVITVKSYSGYSKEYFPNFKEKFKVEFNCNSGLEIERSTLEINERNAIKDFNLNDEILIHEVKDLGKIETSSDFSVSIPETVIAKQARETIISINDGDFPTLESISHDTVVVDQGNCITHIWEDMKSSSIVDSNLIQENINPTQEAKRDLRSCAPDKCPICNLNLTSKLDYDRHARKHYSKSSYDCCLCNQSFTTRDSLIDHFLHCVKKDHVNMKDHSCSICGSFYADHQSVIKHRSLHSECRLVPCALCSFRFFTKKGLELHMRNQHNPLNKYVCPLCNLSFYCKGYLLAHIAVHTGARPFSCKVCNQKIDTKKAMKLHLKSHGGGSTLIKKYKCKECNFLCETNYGLLKHKLSNHREEIQCTYCDKTFLNPSSYKRHYDLHKSENSFHCKLCTYSTVFKRYLDKHMLTHPASSHFTCSRCYVPLSSKHTVGIHIKNYCSKNASRSKSSYDENHIKFNEYKCNLCLYNTSCKQNMEKHMITHPSVTNFSCPKCCVPLSSKHTIGHHLRSYCTKINDSIIVDEF